VATEEGDREGPMLHEARQQGRGEYRGAGRAGEGRNRVKPDFMHVLLLVREESIVVAVMQDQFVSSHFTRLCRVLANSNALFAWIQRGDVSGDTDFPRGPTRTDLPHFDAQPICRECSQTGRP